LKLFKFLVLSSLVLIILPPAGADKKPFEIEDLYRLKFVRQLALSPDGGSLLFTLDAYDLQKGKTFSDIYRLDLATKKTRRLTYGESADYGPLWGKDARYIYFLSSRDEGAQLWRMASDGGEAEKISSFSPGLSSPLIFSDHGAVLFSASVFPECGADSGCHKKLNEKLKDGPTQGHYGKSLLFRHWASYRDWRYTHLFKLDLDKGAVETITEGAHDYPVYGGAFTLSPDEEEICVTVNFDEDAAISTNSDLYLIDLKTGERKNITQGNPAFDGAPAYSPDGRYIAYKMQRIPSYESDKFRLAVYKRDSGEASVLTEDLDNWVRDFKWAPDSKSIYFRIPEKGNEPIYRVNVADGKIDKVLEFAFIREYDVTPDGKTLVMTRSSVGEPYEIWRYEIGSGKGPERLTDFNRSVEETVDIRPAEQAWVKGADGRMVHLFIVKPHGFDPSVKYPLILNVHGGPQYQWSDAFRGDWQVYPGAGYVVAFPNPHGSIGYGQAYTAAISADYDGKVMEDVMKVTDYLASLPYVDEKRMGAMGWSWGGYAMMWLEGKTDRFKALVAMMGIFDMKSMYYSTEELWFPEWDNGGTPWDNGPYYDRVSPSSYVTNFKTPCLIITGERDYRVPYTQSIQFFTALQKMKVPSEIIIFSNDGHWPDLVKSMPVYYNAHLDWFHRYLGGGEPPYDTGKMLRNLQFEEEAE
jgi:dipeptidyl aminopeptidase/acylaminoacyl peptidase